MELKAQRWKMKLIKNTVWFDKNKVFMYSSPVSCDERGSTIKMYCSLIPHLLYNDMNE